jgi:hypothetical protein
MHRSYLLRPGPSANVRSQTRAAGLACKDSQLDTSGKLRARDLQAPKSPADGVKCWQTIMTSGPMLRHPYIPVDHKAPRAALEGQR